MAFAATPTKPINPYVQAKLDRAAERAAMAETDRRAGIALQMTRGDKRAALALMLSGKGL